MISFATSAKDLRTSAEDLRTSAEDLRTCAEDLRTCAEDLRTSAEDLRTSAEDLRTRAEDLSTGAERPVDEPRSWQAARISSAYDDMASCQFCGVEHGWVGLGRVREHGRDIFTLLPRHLPMRLSLNDSLGSFGDRFLNEGRNCDAAQGGSVFDLFSEIGGKSGVDTLGGCCQRAPSFRTCCLGCRFHDSRLTLRSHPYK